MNKVLKNLHWFIIAYAFVNIYLAYIEKEELLAKVEADEAAQQTLYKKNRKVQKEIENFYKNIDEEKLKIERVAQEIERTQQVLPSDVSDVENITLVRRLADDVNIKEIGIAPNKETDHGFYIVRDYKINAKATYLQFLILFEKISENQRILNIGQMSFKKLTEPQRGRFEAIAGEFTIHAYRYNANYKEDRGIEEIENKFKGKTAPAKKPSTGEKEQ